MRGAKVSQITPLNSPGAAGKGSGVSQQCCGAGKGREAEWDVFTSTPEIWAQSPGAPLRPCVLKDGEGWHCPQCERLHSHPYRCPGWQSCNGRGGWLSFAGAGLQWFGSWHAAVLCPRGVNGVEK